MTSTMVVTPFRAAPGRACRPCTLCCKVYALPEFEKPPGAWCKHSSPGKGCKMHDEPPNQCRQFYCLWMTDGALPEAWRPDHAKFVLSIFPPNGFVYGQVDPGSPGAWRREPYYAGLKSHARKLVRERRHVIMFVSDHPAGSRSGEERVSGARRRREGRGRVGSEDPARGAFAVRCEA